jgi:uncharacterized protein YbjT (DUF2867 family)
MRILIIGAYGLIGGFVTARLLRDGHTVLGAGRDVAAAKRRAPKVEWVEADLATMDAVAWAPLLSDVDAVVNCAGALQDSPRDNLRAAHITGLSTLAAACVTAGVRRFVQVSAAGVETGPGAFSRTKQVADELLRGFDLDWVILRPGLVLAPSAYGGSALLRGLAGFPGVIPAGHASSVVQVVSIEDLAEAVVRAIQPGSRGRITCDLVAPELTTAADILEALRAWLGFKPAPVLVAPPALMRFGAWAADTLAWLGWRSPMRTAALTQLAAGVRGEATDGARQLGFAPRGLEAILADWPSGVQERWFARLYFVKPLTLATLAAFWIASGLIGLAHRDAAAQVLTQAGLDGAIARGFVMAGGLADIALGLLVCGRRTAPLALKGMLVVTAAYLFGATLWRPDLWADPMGPLVKTLPAAILAVAALAMMDER